MKFRPYIGRIANGFDFLGYRFSTLGVIGLAQQTIDNYYNRIAELYEQHTDGHCMSYYKKNVGNRGLWVVVLATP